VSAVINESHVQQKLLIEEEQAVQQPQENLVEPNVRIVNEEITVVGAGYLGLVVAACFAAKGHHVTCVDSDGLRINRLQSGNCPIYEPGLDEMVRIAMEAEHLSFTTESAVALTRASMILLCVGTPSLQDGAVDLSQLVSAVKKIACCSIRQGIPIVIKSTVPVGTAELVEELLTESGKCGYKVISIPEFIREGTAIVDFMGSARIVIGARTQAAAEQVLELYQPFVREHTRVFIMDNRSAELTKYAANVALAARLSLINDLAKLADALGADIEHVRRAVGADPRVGDAYMQPGIGFGGSCLPKDVRALVRMSHEKGVAPRMAEAILAVNSEQACWFVGKILCHFGNALTGRRLTVWGLAFKPGTDDVRESVSLSVIEELLAHGVVVTVYDPRAMVSARTVLGNRVAYATDMYASLVNSEAIVVATEWEEFIRADLKEIALIMKGSVVFDGRNTLNSKRVSEVGLTYIGVGRV